LSGSAKRYNTTEPYIDDIQAVELATRASAAGADLVGGGWGGKDGWGHVRTIAGARL
jgi:galactokinase